MRRPANPVVRTATEVTALLIALASGSMKSWVFDQAGEQRVVQPEVDYYLSENNGAHSVAMREYTDPDNAKRIWIVIGSCTNDTATPLRVYEYDDWNRWKGMTEAISSLGDYSQACVAVSRNATETNKHMLVYGDAGCRALALNEPLESTGSEWSLTSNIQNIDEDVLVALAAHRTNGSNLVHQVFVKDGELTHRRSTDDGATWTPLYGIQRGLTSMSSVSVEGADGTDTAFVCHDNFLEGPPARGDIIVWQSLDGGSSWLGVPVFVNQSEQDVYLNPCLVAAAGMACVAWVANDDSLMFSWSTDAGFTWEPEQRIPCNRDDWSFGSPNLFLTIMDDDEWSIVVVSPVYTESDDQVAFCSARMQHGGSSWVWAPWFFVPSPEADIDDLACPSLAGCNPTQCCPKVCFVWTDNRNSETQCREVYRRVAHWTDIASQLPRAAVTNVGRRIRVDPDGEQQYTSTLWGNVIAGPITKGSSLPPYVVGQGDQPAMAVDADAQRWVTFLRVDTVWTAPCSADTQLRVGSQLLLVLGRAQIAQG